MIFGIFVVLFLIVCLCLIFLVLIQSDKGGGLSGAIGGGLAGANTLLGSQDTANILTRGTTIFATAYMILCILLSLFLSRLAPGNTQESLLRKRAETQESYSPSSILPLGEGETGLPQGNEPIEEDANEEQAPALPQEK